MIERVDKPLQEEVLYIYCERLLFVCKRERYVNGAYRDLISLSAKGVQRRVLAMR